MPLDRLWFLIPFLLFFFFFHDPIFTVAGYSSGLVSKFLSFDDDFCDSQAKASFLERCKLALVCRYENRIATGVIILMTILNIIVFELREFLESKFDGKEGVSSFCSGQTCRRFSLAEIELATYSFDDAFVIGQGGFGKVYKGVIDNGATTVAIKRLSSMSKQGGSEFWTEIEMLSKFRHCHLVSLIGYCDERHEMILVYEYISRGNLSDHLHISDMEGNTSSLSWVQRLRICIGAARGLDYLHTGTSIQQRVIHRDVKSTNILLDENLEAKVSDFGLSKLGPANEACTTYVSTDVKGTFGYIDPEYFLTRRLSRKSDVYAFGVVLFEVLCGRRAVDLSLNDDQCGLVGWAQLCISEARVHQLLDYSLNMQIVPDSLLVFVGIAQQCLHSWSKCRPTMAEVVVILEFALALQENKNSSEVYEAIADYYRNAQSSTLEKIIGDNMNQIKPFQKKHTRLTFSRKIRQFLAAPIRVIVQDKVQQKVRLNRIGVVPVARGRIVTTNWKTFTLAELRCASRNFNADMLLGEGCYGKVFLGWLNEDTLAPSKTGQGIPIAIKRFNRTEGLKYVQNEVNLNGKFQHPNLVKVLGFFSDDHEFILVYQYMQKGSLEKYVYREYGETLTWVVWLKILIEAARFLAFLHKEEQKIIYSDFKPANILLDEDFNPKIVDCGRSRICPTDSNTSVTQSEVQDTSGCLSPQDVAVGHVSVKNDVFSFGVLLLEILTGMRMMDFDERHKKQSLVNLSRPYLADKTRVKKVINPKLLEHDDSCLKGAILLTVPALTLKCLNPKPENRPSMMEILRTLEKINTFAR